MTTLTLMVQEPSVELVVTSNDGSAKQKSLTVGFKRYQRAEADARIKEYETIVEAADFNINDSPELDTFIKEEILYMKGLSVPYQDAEGKDKTLRIMDTRKAAKLETLWESPEQCLAVLLDAYFQWSSWRVSFISAVQTALADLDFKEAQRKNF